VSYSAYLDWAAQHLRVGGVVLGDNTFGWGDVVRVPELTGQAKDTVGALDQFNRRLAADPRFVSTIWPTAEGLTMGVKIRD
jgi:caffeoyl-CoA O-methyltransferase